MEIVSRPRHAGKTTEVIKIAGKHFSYIICPDRQQVQHIARMARDMDIDIPFPLTWQEFLEKRYYGENIGSFVIDNLDMCIQSMTPVEIKAVSLNGDTNTTGVENAPAAQLEGSDGK